MDTKFMKPKGVSKVIVFDMDGVIFRETNFWLKVHKVMGTEKEGFRLTKRYLRSDYPKLAEGVLKLWKGKSAMSYFKLIKRSRYVQGAEVALNQLKRFGYYLIIISSGSYHLLKRAMRELPIDEGYANELEVRAGRFTGKLRRVVKDTDKLALLQTVCKKIDIPPKEVIAVGDSENDIPIFKKVGFAIAFCPASKKVENAAGVSVKFADLRRILRFLQ